MQNAFDQLWGYAPEMFEVPDDEQQLVDAGIAVNRSTLEENWTSAMHSVLKQATLDIPADNWAIGGGRQGEHTEHLGYLLAEMQFLQRSYPGQQW